MTALAVSEHLRFRLAYRPTLDMALLFAAGIHLAAFLLIPRSVPSPIAPIEEEVIFIENVADDVVVPLPPVEIPLPPIPMAADFEELIVSDDADLDETIADTEIDLSRQEVARLDYVKPQGEDSEFLTYSDLPRIKRMVHPVYPDLARQAGIEGTVYAKAFLDERGRVIRVEIVESPAEIFEKPVIDALLRSEFFPALQREIPVKSRIIVPFAFSLRKSRGGFD